MKKFMLLSLLITISAIFSGCYTQLIMVDKTPPREEVSWEVDSVTGDTVKVIKQIDTVHTQDNRICVWERDLMGYPYLRCYDSFYPRDWFYFHYTPWWYYDYPYGSYYYHGGRRYYRPHHHREYHEGQKEPEPAGPSGSIYRSRTRGIPGPDAQSVKQSGGNAAPAVGSEKGSASQSSPRVQGEIIIQQENTGKPIVVQERSRSVPAEGAPVQSSQPHSSAAVQPDKSTTDQVQSSATPPPSDNKQSGSFTAPSENTSHQPYNNSNANNKGPHLKRARRW